MDLFPNSNNHHKWSWISDLDDPWVIFSEKFDNSLQKMILRAISDETTDCKDLSGVDASNGPIFVHPSVKISSSVRMEGPIYIEEGVEIRHCAYLRPWTYISSGCVVGHSSEIKNTLMLPGSKAPHFNYVGDSILGFAVNIGAGVKISNVRLDGKTIAIQCPDGTKVDSGLRKLGAMIGDHTQIGCNVVTNPGAVLPPASGVPPNSVVTGYWGL